MLAGRAYHLGCGLCRKDRVVGMTGLCAGHRVGSYGSYKGTSPFHRKPVIPDCGRSRPQGWRQGGGSRSFGLAGGQAQARQEKLAVLGVAIPCDARHDQRGNGAQLCNDHARFVEPPHMGIARGEKAV